MSWIRSAVGYLDQKLRDLWTLSHPSIMYRYPYRDDLLLPYLLQEEYVVLVAQGDVCWKTVYKLYETNYVLGLFCTVNKGFHIPRSILNGTTYLALHLLEPVELFIESERLNRLDIQGDEGTDAKIELGECPSLNVILTSHSYGIDLSKYTSIHSNPCPMDLVQEKVKERFKTINIDSSTITIDSLRTLPNMDVYLLSQQRCWCRYEDKIAYLVLLASRFPVRVLTTNPCGEGVSMDRVREIVTELLDQLGHPYSDQPVVRCNNKDYIYEYYKEQIDREIMRDSTLLEKCYR